MFQNPKPLDPKPSTSPSYMLYKLNVDGLVGKVDFLLGKVILIVEEVIFLLVRGQGTFSYWARSLGLCPVII